MPYLELKEQYYACVSNLKHVNAWLALCETLANRASNLKTDLRVKTRCFYLWIVCVCNDGNIIRIGITGITSLLDNWVPEWNTFARLDIVIDIFRMIRTIQKYISQVRLRYNQLEGDTPALDAAPICKAHGSFWCCKQRASRKGHTSIPWSYSRIACLRPCFTCSRNCDSYIVSVMSWLLCMLGLLWSISY